MSQGGQGVSKGLKQDAGSLLKMWNFNMAFDHQILKALKITHLDSLFATWALNIALNVHIHCFSIEELA